MSNPESNRILIASACAACLWLGWALGQRRRRLFFSPVHDREFQVVTQLSEGKHEVIKLGLSTVLLTDDKRYPWLVLVPRKSDAIEVIDLDPAQQQQLWEEVAHASAIVQKLPGVEKLNVATLGNVCSQLHIHVTGRHAGDAAWPGPCYGVGTAEPYSKEELQSSLEKLRSAFAQRRQH